VRVDKGVAPLAVVAFGIFLLCMLDAFMKALLQTHGTGFAVTLRYVSGAFWAVLLFAAFRVGLPGAASLRANLLRSVVVIFTALSFFYAIGTLPFAEAIAITFTSPIFIALLGRTMLGEKIGGHILLAVLLGSAGVVIILSGRIELARLDLAHLGGAIAALLSAMSYALATVLMRRQTARDNTLTIVMLQNVFAAMLSLPIGAMQFEMPTRSDLLLAAAAGLFGTLGHCAMAWGYARAEAARLGALEYTAFIWASLLGWAFFSETPSALVAIGAVLIIGGAVAASWGVRRRGEVLVEEV
jgi:drug/metabolite transporter (DMT)-like permease